MPQIEVELPLLAKWPSKTEIASRDEVVEQLDALGIGKCTGRGGGMGKMDFSFCVPDETAATDAIRRVMAGCMPGIKYTVRVLPRG
jgi:hypothetical protein